MHLYWVYLKLIARVYYSFYIFIREKASMYSKSSYLIGVR